MSREPARHCPGCNGYMASWDLCEGMGDPGLTSVLEAALMEYAWHAPAGLSAYPGDARVIGAFLATREARSGGSKPGLFWRERRQDAYWQEWYCEPPLLRDRFRVTREDWITEDGEPVRRIYEIEGIHGAAGSTGRADSDGHAGSGPGSPGPGPQAPAAPAQGS